MTEDEVMAAAFSDHRFDPSEVDIVARARRAPVAEPEGPAEARAEEEPAEEVVGSSAAEAVDPEVARTHEALREIEARAWTGADWRDAPPPPPEERGELRPEERLIIAGARKCAWLPTSRIRGLGRGRALAALADFVSLHQAAGRPYVRVITGKGVGSPGEPVLKHALVAWCASDGAGLVRGVAPEREATGEFGAFVLALRRPGG